MLDQFISFCYSVEIQRVTNLSAQFSGEKGAAPLTGIPHKKYRQDERGRTFT